MRPAPIVDFDGTVATLDVPWADLRRELGVHRIDDLWSRPADAWKPVTAAEVHAATHAPRVVLICRALVAATQFAVLTSNSESAVAAFLAGQPDLAHRAVAIVGRETLTGAKTDFDVFRAGFERCVAATRAARGDGAVVYVGDQEYEISFARRLGAHALRVDELSNDGCAP